MKLYCVPRKKFFSSVYLFFLHRVVTGCTPVSSFSIARDAAQNLTGAIH